ncbi:MAG: dihydropteroate synthase [Bacteroidales bacterium]|nr:dihydropteroate synthase [Bacteroidales bacterium]
MEYCMKVRGVQMSLAEPVVMGILNCTPDSFYADSRKQTEQEIAERAQQILAEGGRFIDVGAYSTRPGHEVVSEEEEMQRLQVALTVIRREVPNAVVSVDTFRPLVARRCVEEWGADMVNDVSPTTNSSTERSDDRKKAMFEVVSQLDVPYILMSQQPTIEAMLSEWANDVLQLRSMGAKDIILDPGFGFGKTLDENFAVLRQMERLSVLSLPLLVGLSRKRMVWQTLNGSPETALNGTTVLNTIALQHGASILRVHDVREACECVKLLRNVEGASYR